MTIQSDARPPADESPRDEDAVTACEACGHDLALHDAIASRYCRASAAQAGQRGCVCPPAAKGAAVPSEAPAYGRGRFSGR